jgi:hypothetical protein
MHTHTLTLFVAGGVEALVEEVANLRNLVTTMSKQASELQAENDELRKKAGLPPRETRFEPPPEASLEQSATTATAAPTPPQNPESSANAAVAPPPATTEGAPPLPPPPPPPPPPGAPGRFVQTTSFLTTN